MYLTHGLSTPDLYLLAPIHRCRYSSEIHRSGWYLARIDRESLACE